MPRVLQYGLQALVHRHLERAAYRADTPSRFGYVETHSGTVYFSLERNAKAQIITYLDADFVLEAAKKTRRAFLRGAGGSNHHQRITRESP